MASEGEASRSRRLFERVIQTSGDLASGHHALVAHRGAWGLDRMRMESVMNKLPWGMRQHSPRLCLVEDLIWSSPRVGGIFLCLNLANRRLLSQWNQPHLPLLTHRPVART